MHSMLTPLPLWWAATAGFDSSIMKAVARRATRMAFLTAMVTVTPSEEKYVANRGPEAATEAELQRTRPRPPYHTLAQLDHQHFIARVLHASAVDHFVAKNLWFSAQYSGTLTSQSPTLKRHRNGDYNVSPASGPWSAGKYNGDLCRKPYLRACSGRKFRYDHCIENVSDHQKCHMDFHSNIINTIEIATTFLMEGAFE